MHNHCSGAGKAEEKVAMLASTVSSKALGAMAEKEGFLFEDTPVSFLLAVPTVYQYGVVPRAATCEEFGSLRYYAGRLS